jgi:hypothetical protein
MPPGVPDLSIGSIPAGSGDDAGDVVWGFKPPVSRRVEQARTGNHKVRERGMVNFSDFEESSSLNLAEYITARGTRIKPNWGTLP